jgi:hypothetical protein
MTVFSGGCLCGAVRYEGDGKIGMTGHCYSQKTVASQAPSGIRLTDSPVLPILSSWPNVRTVQDLFRASEPRRELQPLEVMAWCGPTSALPVERPQVRGGFMVLRAGL